MKPITSDSASSEGQRINASERSVGVMKRFFVGDCETCLSNCLQAGIIVSASVITIGMLMLLVMGTTGYPQNVFPITFTEVLSGILMLKPAAVITVGILLLIMTPFVRVGLSVILFLREKDYNFTIITGSVLVLLIFTLVFGKMLA